MQLNYKQVALLGGRAARACARVVGLTPARLDLLILLLSGERSQVRLAALMCVTPAVVSRMVRPLEADGLLERRIPAGDRRLRIVRITDEGRRRLAPALDDERKLPPDGSYGAQTDGECSWSSDWRVRLAGLGVRLWNNMVRPLPEHMYYAMQHWNRVHTYDDLYDDEWWGPVHP